MHIPKKIICLWISYHSLVQIEISRLIDKFLIVSLFVICRPDIIWFAKYQILSRLYQSIILHVFCHSGHFWSIECSLKHYLLTIFMANIEHKFYWFLVYYDQNLVCKLSLIYPFKLKIALALIFFLQGYLRCVKNVMLLTKSS